MCETGHYLGFDIFLDLVPLLPLLGRSRGKKFAEVAWGHIGKDAAVLNIFVIIDDYSLMSDVSVMKEIHRAVLHTLVYRSMSSLAELV